ncbi:MAG TPA: enoyl-CoA hydratase [Hyphomicrobiaceae bacterium]|jgi:enoyl-CoA hydratase/carnithine racemase|nr:enoyl-CoA hydratase [Hyphomicrobiaceae bacterium]
MNDASDADGDLLYKVSDGIGHITFNRPAAHNALTFDMYDRLGAILGEIRLGGAVKAVIITGAGGRAFAAGTDISLFRDFATAADGIAYEARMERMFAKLERCPVPTIAAIAGVCTGGAAVIAAACDLRIATRQLKYGFPIARTLANCLSAANIARVGLIIGVGRAVDLLLTTRLIGADEALAIGLVSELVETGEALDQRAHALAAQIASQAPLTMMAGKEIVRRMRAKLADIDDRDVIERCYGSADFREGLTAFLDKRQPKFRAR